MAMLGSADVSFLYRARAGRITEHTIVVDAEIAEHLADALAVRIRSDDACQRTLGPQRAPHRCHAAGPAKAFFALLRAQQNDWRFLADALGVAPDIAIQHQIAHDQHARLAEVLHKVNQLGGHCLTKSEIRNPKSEIRNRIGCRFGFRISNFGSTQAARGVCTTAVISEATTACSSGSSNS